MAKKIGQCRIGRLFLNLLFHVLTYSSLVHAALPVASVDIDEKRESCGFAAAKLALRFLKDSLDSNQEDYSRSVYEQLLPLVDPYEPTTLQTLRDQFTRLGFKVSPFRVLSGDSISAFTNLERCVLNDGPVAIVLAAPVSLSDFQKEWPRVEGHYFLVFRGKNGELISIDPVAFSRKRLIDGIGFGKDAIALIIQKPKSILHRNEMIVLAIVLTLLLGGWAIWQRNDARRADARLEVRRLPIMASLLVTVGIAIFVSTLFGTVSQYRWFSSSALLRSDRPAPTPASPDVQLIQAEYDEPRFFAGTKKSFRFSFSNTGDFPMEVYQFVSSCSCIELECPDKTLAPGETYDGRGAVLLPNHGGLSQQLIGRTRVKERESTIGVKLSAEITESTDWFTTTQVHFDSIPAVKDEIVPIRLFQGRPFQVEALEVRQLPDFLCVERSVSTENGYDIDLRVTKPTIAKNFRCEMHCTIKSAEFPSVVLVIPVTGNIDSAISIFPSRSVVTESGKPVSLWVRIADRKLLPLSVTGTNGNLSCNLVEEPRGEEEVVVYRLDIVAYSHEEVSATQHRLELRSSINEKISDVLVISKQ